MNRILKLTPFHIEKIWGHEKWNLSTHRNGHSTIEGSNDTLLAKVEKNLPILIKIIQANDTLSVQVHPDDEYSRKFENDNGKTECWYILDTKGDATLVCGIKDGLNRNDISKAIEENKMEKNLKRISVEPGDMIYIPSGTVHAIEGGIKLIEVQQSSDLTYRMYDWGRNRELHIEKSLDIIDYERKNKCGKIDNFTTLRTPYFTVEKIIVEDYYEDWVNEAFHSYTAIEGSAYLVSGEDKVIINKEETVYIPHGIVYTINGKIELLKSYV